MTYLHDIDPIALHLPFWPHGIHWYGLMYLLGFGVAWWIGRRRVRAGRFPGVDENAFGDLLFYGMLGVVLGGRVGYVLFYAFEDFLKAPVFLLRINEGGMSFHGGLLGVMVAALWWSRARRVHFFDSMDFVAPLVPAGLGFGRIGNFIGGELWGKHTGAGWGVIFPRSDLGPYSNLPMAELHKLHASGALDAYASHPSQLYQAFLEGLVMTVVLLWYSSTPRPRYAVSGWFALLYGMFRIAVEFVRVPDQQRMYFFGTEWITEGMLLSVPLLIVGLLLLWLSRRAPIASMPAALSPASGSSA